MFGDIKELNESNGLGFVYRIDIQKHNYIGIKHFNQGVNWKTYQGSSKTFKKIIKSYKRIKPTYTVIGIFNTENEAHDMEMDAIEGAWIKGVTTDTLKYNHNLDCGTGHDSRRTWVRGWYSAIAYCEGYLAASGKTLFENRKV